MLIHIRETRSCFQSNLPLLSDFFILSCQDQERSSAKIYLILSSENIYSSISLRELQRAEVSLVLLFPADLMGVGLA